VTPCSLLYGKRASEKPAVFTSDLGYERRSFLWNVGYHQHDRQIRLQVTLDIAPPFVHHTLWHYAESDILSVVVSRNTDNVWTYKCYLEW